MEKDAPHCKRSVVKTRIQTGKVHAAMPASADGRLDFDEIVDVAMELKI